jgi:hypothetical protein
MGFFNLFKNKTTLVDEVFGELNYTTFKDVSKNYYEGEVSFQGKQIGITIDADKSGPTAEQQAFFKRLNATYSQIKERVIVPFLKEELADTVQNTGLDNFDETFVLDGISLGVFKEGETEWTITYDATVMKHYVSIACKGLKGMYITVDG